MLNETQMGKNRTGMEASPEMANLMTEGLNLAPVSPAPEMEEMNQIRQKYYDEAEPVGSLPAPAAPEAAKKAGGTSLKARSAQLFINKLGERLAFERTGVRLYEALLTKCQFNVEVPFLDDLKHYYKEEEEHFHLLTQAMRALGADPTAVTPDADVTGVASQGLLKVISDPRTTIAQSMEALLVAELVDNDCWKSLIEMAESVGYDKVVKEFQKALQQEEEHLQGVRKIIKEMNQP